MNKKASLVLAIISIVALVWMNSTTAQTETTVSSLPVYNTDGSQVTNAHVVIGSVVVPAGTSVRPNGSPTDEVLDGVRVTLTGAAAFTTVDTYNCVVSEPAAAPNPIFNSLFRKIDGHSFTIRAGRGNNEWRQGFICVGS